MTRIGSDTTVVADPAGRSEEGAPVRRPGPYGASPYADRQSRPVSLADVLDRLDQRLRELEGSDG